MHIKLFALIRILTYRNEFQPYYYRTGTGAEIDLIIKSVKEFCQLKLPMREKSKNKGT